MLNTDFQETVDFIKSQFSNKDFVSLHEPVFVGNERKYVMDAIDSTFVSSVGKYVDQFEDIAKEYTGAKHAIAVVNGTAALHIALQLAGVERGDYVLTQALSFIATCNAISYLGANPYFLDVNRERMGLSYESLKAFLETKVKVENNIAFLKEDGKRIMACVPMHTFGFPVEIDQIVELCNKYHIVVVEDSAESIGSFYKGKSTGTFGKIGTFSFNGNKTITAGGGGLLVTDDEGLGKFAKHLTTQAKIPHRWDFRHDYIGYNYRMPNLNAAMICAQMEQLEVFIQDKRNLANTYNEFFSNKNIQFILEPEQSRSNYWLNSILFETQQERDNFLDYSNSNKVMTRPLWTLMNKLKMFIDCKSEDLSNSIFLEERLVNIPSGVREMNIEKKTNDGL